MKKTTETVQKINRAYVRDDCVQVIVPYKRAMTIVGPEGIMYSHKSGTHSLFNKYLEDERRRRFPYSNIPTHFSKDILFRTIYYANQIFDCDTPYIRIGDCGIIESFAVKDNNGALIINKSLDAEKEIRYVSRQELEDIFSDTSSINGNSKFVIQIDDYDFSYIYPRPLASEERIHDFIKDYVSQNLKDLRNFIKENKETNYSAIRNYLLNNQLFLDFVEGSLKSFDLNNMQMDINLKGGRAVIVRSKGSDITAQYVVATFVSQDKYKLEVANLPINKYTLEQLKHLSSKIIQTKEPRIPLMLNPGVTKEDVQEAKRMAKILK